MSNLNGTIDNDSQSRSLSTTIRESIQNKNLLQRKDDLYSNIGVIHRGKEGELLGYDNIYEPVLKVKSDLPAVNVTAREGLNITTEPSLFGERNHISYIIYKEFYPCDFLSYVYNESATCYFSISFPLAGNTYTSTISTPVVFFKKEVFNNKFCVLNTEPFANNEHCVFHEYEKYYIYNSSLKEMVNIDLNSSNFSSAFEQYGYLYTKQIYSAFCCVPSLNKYLKIELDEEGIYGVFEIEIRENKIRWRKTQIWDTIFYTVIQ